MTGSDPNEEGLRALGRAVGEASSSRPRRRRSAPEGRGPAHAPDRPAPRSGRPRRRRFWLRRALVIGAVLVVLVVGAGLGYGYYLNHEVHRVTVNGLAGSTTTGADAGTENILMVGSTTRCGLAHQTAAYGLCTQGVTGVNSDVVMILHLNPQNKSVSILSLPRDLFVPNARTTGAWKIDAALAQGPSQLVAVIEEDFGIPIQHYVELNFDTFAGVVTALGGITLEFPVPVYDRYSGLRVLQTGCHHLNGVQALQVVRARHLQYWQTGDTRTTPSTWPQEAQSDLARIRRDHEFLRVLASAVSSRGLGDPGTDLSLINAIAPKLTVDSGLSATAMVHLVLTYHSVKVGSAPQLTLPVQVATFGTYHYQGGSFGNVEFPTEPADQSVVDQFLGLGPDTNTMTGNPLPAPSAVTVSVLNGTGATSQATLTSTALGHLGFQMVGVGDTTPVASVSETLVTYAHRTPADEAAAQLVADSISGQVTLAYGPTTDGAEVTVTTGSNFTVNATAPAPAATAAKASGASKASGTSATTAATTPPTSPAATSSATATPGTSSTANFAPATPASQALQPWDPRACPPGVKGNAGNW